jgi:hypothetical protein
MRPPGASGSRIRAPPVPSGGASPGASGNPRRAVRRRGQGDVARRRPERAQYRLTAKRRYDSGNRSATAAAPSSPVSSAATVSRADSAVPG